jgi:GNAT superfamily N-acetyltransferase
MDELRAAGLADAFLTLEQTAQNEGLFDGTVVVALAHDQIQGFVAFTANEVTWLYVYPAAYRTGVGRALLRHAIACCGGNLTIELLVGNEPALHLYLSEGFRMVKRVDGRLTGNEAFAASGYVLQRDCKNSSVRWP